MRRLSRLAALACLGASIPAWADHYSIHGTANGDVATTDNVFSAETGRQGDIFFQLRPGLLFAYDAPRMIQELSTEVEFLEYIANSEVPSVTFRGGWKAFFIPGPRSEVTLTVNGSNGQLHSLTTRTSPDQTGLQVLPPGRVDTTQGDVGEHASWQSSKSTRLSQTAFARGTITDDAMLMVESQSGEVGARLSFEYSLKQDTFGVDGGASLLQLERKDPMGFAMGSRFERQANPSASLYWRHDVDKFWSTSLDGGLVYVNPIGKDKYNPTAVRRAAPFPVYGGLLAYSDVWGRAILNVRRSVTPNEFLAQNTVNDVATLQFAVPLSLFDRDARKRAPKVVGLASMGVDRTQLVDPEQADARLGQFFLVHLDAGIAWAPRAGQTYGIRYEFAYQRGKLPAQDTTTYFRNTVFFTFALRYPERVAATVPRRTQSVRSDRKDLAPIGAEPVVPDAAEPQPEGEGGEGAER